MNQSNAIIEIVVNDQLAIKVNSCFNVALSIIRFSLKLHAIYDTN